MILLSLDGGRIKRLLTKAVAVLFLLFLAIFLGLYLLIAPFRDEMVLELGDANREFSFKIIRPFLDEGLPMLILEVADLQSNEEIEVYNLGDEERWWDRGVAELTAVEYGSVVTAVIEESEDKPLLIWDRRTGSYETSILFSGEASASSGSLAASLSRELGKEICIGDLWSRDAGVQCSKQVVTVVAPP